MIKQASKYGFSLIEVVLVIVVIGIIAAGGYLYFQRQAPTKSSTKTSASQSTEKAKLTWQKGGVAVSGTFADADVINYGPDQWRMYYGIQPEVKNNRLEVYSATSTDGVTWTQESGTRKIMATFPDVVQLADKRYRMYFQQGSVIKSAISTDGLTFTDESGTRMDKSNPAGLTLDNVAAPTVYRQSDGTFMMVYRGTMNTRYAQNTPNPTTQVLLWATSNDGLTFTSKGIAVDSRTSTLNGQLDGPDLVLGDDNQLHVYATTYTGVFEFIFDGTKFDAGTLVYAGEAQQTNMGFTGAPPGDPTVAKIDDVWYMYHGNPKSENGIGYAVLK